MNLFFGFGSSWVTGYLFLSWLVDQQTYGDGLVKIFLSPAVGFGLSVLILCFELFCFNRVDLLFAMSVHLILIFIFFIMARGKNRFTVPVGKYSVLWVGVLFVVLAALVLTVMMKSPYGTGVDAWANWRVKARFIYYGGPDWRRLLSPVLDYSHPDYPLYFPLLIVWGWLWQGEVRAVSFTIAILFSFFCAGFLYSVFLGEKKEKTGVLAAFFCLSAPAYTALSGAQYADILHAYYVLVGVFLLGQALKRKTDPLMFIAGWVFGIDSFLKNEGWLLFWVALAILLWLGRRRGFLVFILGALPGVIATVLVKKMGTFSNEIMNFHNVSDSLAQVDFLQRSKLIIFYGWENLKKQNEWSLIWPFFTVAFIFGRKGWTVDLIVGAFLILFKIASYFVVYLFMTRPFPMCIDTSVHRLFLHVFPCLVYLSFGCVSGLFSQDLHADKKSGHSSIFELS